MKYSNAFALAGALATVLAATALQAQTLTFEGLTTLALSVDPSTPLATNGYTLSVTNSGAAAVIFPKAGNFLLIGDPTSFFGFAAGNVVTLTGPGAGTFDLTQLLLGPSTGGSGILNIGVAGIQSGGGAGYATSFLSLTTATLETLNWTNLASVTFDSSTDAGLDNIVVSPFLVPEPSSMALLGGCLFGLGFVARRRTLNEDQPSPDVLGIHTALRDGSPA